MKTTEAAPRAGRADVSAKNSPCIMQVFARIAQERLRQEELFHAGHHSFTCSSLIADDNRKLRVLMEEVGEVARSIDLLEGLTVKRAIEKELNNLRDELTQVAAVAVAWLESMEDK
jgi:NTP pyrophosphatase (non-canonical NTP hydrolase)